MKFLTLASEILIDNISSLYQSPGFEGIRGSGKLHTSDRLQDLLHAFTYRIRRDYCKLCTRTCMLMGFFRPLPGIFAEVLSFKSTSWSFLQTLSLCGTCFIYFLCGWGISASPQTDPHSSGWRSDRNVEVGPSVGPKADFVTPSDYLRRPNKSMFRVCLQIVLLWIKFCWAWEMWQLDMFHQY